MNLRILAVAASIFFAASSQASTNTNYGVSLSPSLQGSDPYPPTEPIPPIDPRECISNDHNTVCVDDVVIPEDFRFGTATVVHVNEARDFVIVRGNSDNQLYQRRPFQLYLVNGCVDDVCGGESVIPDIFANGYATVTAVNPYRRLALVQGDIDQRYYTINTMDIAITMGCLQRMCIRDIVIGRHIGRARVVAINFNKYFTVVLSQRDRQYYRLSPNDLIPDRK